MKQLRDKNGLTEEEFLARYDASKFERPSVTVDLVLFWGNKLLLIRRGGHPSLGKLAFPGGFVEPNETVEEAAVRELMEETHVQSVSLRQLPVFSEPKRDPRTRIITVPFLVTFSEEESEVRAGDDASDAAFWDVLAEEEETAITFTLQNGTQKTSVRVERIRSPFGQMQYKVCGDSALAGDHGAILACAWDARKNER